MAFQGPEQNTHYEIVGVVKDVKYESLRGDFPRTVYMTISAGSARTRFVCILRADGSGHGLGG